MNKELENIIRNFHIKLINELVEECDRAKERIQVTGTSRVLVGEALGLQTAVKITKGMIEAFEEMSKLPKGEKQ